MARGYPPLHARLMEAVHTKGTDTPGRTLPSCSSGGFLFCRCWACDEALDSRGKEQCHEVRKGQSVQNAPHYRWSRRDHGHNGHDGGRQRVLRCNGGVSARLPGAGGVSASASTIRGHSRARGASGGYMCVLTTGTRPNVHGQGARDPRPWNNDHTDYGTAGWFRVIVG